MSLGWSPEHWKPGYIRFWLYVLSSHRKYLMFFAKHWKLSWLGYWTHHFIPMQIRFLLNSANLINVRSKGSTIFPNSKRQKGQISVHDAYYHTCMHAGLQIPSIPWVSITHLRIHTPLSQTSPAPGLPSFQLLIQHVNLLSQLCFLFGSSHSTI